MYVRRRGRGFGGLGQTSGIATIAATIQQIEGWSPGTIAYTNNNPGNLIYVGQTGATQGPAMTGTPYYFASFSSYDAGEAALQNQIQNYANQGLTINQMMAKYAPATDANGNPTGNNPTAYANSIANSLGVSPDTTVAAAISGGATSSDTSDETGDWWETEFTDPLNADLSSFSSSLDDSGDSSGVTGVSVDPVLLAGGVVLAALALYLVSA
jgi:hypothetical protein